jgi:hypothetical protein
MPPKIKSRLAAEDTRLSRLKPLMLHAPADRGLVAKAVGRRPILPTHTTGASSHAQHHAPLKAQS